MEAGPRKPSGMAPGWAPEGDGVRRSGLVLSPPRFLLTHATLLIGCTTRDSFIPHPCLSLRSRNKVVSVNAEALCCSIFPHIFLTAKALDLCDVDAAKAWQLESPTHFVLIRHSAQEFSFDPQRHEQADLIPFAAIWLFLRRRQ